MQPGTPSATAVGVASLRAAHLHLFDDPKIHEDAFALQNQRGKERRGPQGTIGEVQSVAYPCVAAPDDPTRT